MKDFNEWLKTLPHPHKFVVAGNHDVSEEIPLQEIVTNAKLLQVSLQVD